MSEAQQWKIIEHSWRNTSIENENGRIICELDLESFDNLNEDNQNEYEQLQRADAELIASAPAFRDERDRLYRALRNCHTLARRQSKKEKQLAASAWPSIIRFCEEVGITQDGVLRADARAAQIEEGE